MEEKIRLAVFGQKRLSREGGIEIVVKELCTRMAQNGCDITCYNRAGHHVSGAEYDKTIEYDGIRQKVVPTIEKKGYVGLSIATLLSQHHKVMAVDIVPEKVELINNKKSPIQDEYIEKYLAEKELDLTATLDAKEAYSDADFVVIAAPTNYDSKKNFFDTSAVAKKDDRKISSVLKAAENFFRQIASIFVFYTIALACVYPIVIKSSFSWLYVASLTVILSFTLFIQYFFSITYKLLLQADQKMYIVQLWQSLITLLNIIAVVVSIKLFPELHFVKLCSVLLFAIQPVAYSNYVKKHYKLYKDVEPDKNSLAQRWACFGQNFAYFIHSNTDVVVLTLFSDLKTVSVYSVYLLVVKNLQNLFKSFSNAFNPMIGKAIAVNDYKQASKYMETYEFVVSNVATIIFGCCIYLLPSFVLIYTHGVTDTNYYRVIFSTIIIFAEYIYCIRDPYVSVVYAAGKFKETSNSAYIEAIINIVLSVILVFKFGLEGIAVGTFIGMLYRMIYLVWFINKDIMPYPISNIVKRLSLSIGTIVISCLIVSVLDTTGSSTLILWVKNGVLCFGVYCAVTVVLNFAFDKELFLNVCKKAVRKRKG